jgi:2'-5' RNA ligase
MKHRPLFRRDVSEESPLTLAVKETQQMQNMKEQLHAYLLQKHLNFSPHVTVISKPALGIHNSSIYRTGRPVQISLLVYA